jgi:hypothetical protein
MMRFSVLLLSILMGIVSCGQGLPVVKRVNELAPPRGVEIRKESGQLILRWQPSFHVQSPEFDGYAIYIANRSLMFAPLTDLPAPILVPNDVTRFALSDFDSTGLYFIHVRSRKRNGDVSLPSLPELVWPERGAP